VLRVVPGDLVGGEARVAARRQEVARLAERESRRMSSTMLRTVRWKSRARCSWLPWKAARFWRMRTAPSA